MKRKNTINAGGILFLMILLYLLYRALVQNDILPFSIDAVQATMNHWVKHWHIIVVGLLPVYVAVVLLGVVLSGVCIGSAVQRWLLRLFQK